MKSQIPAVAAKYFESVGIDLAEHHPVVSATFTPKRGWVPVVHEVPVSHAQLVRLRDNHGVTAVCLKALNPGGYHNLPDFELKHLIRDMTALDAEFADGVPVSEGSGVVADRTRIGEILVELGFTPGDAVTDLLDRADKTGVEFSVDRRDSMTRAFEEGWRYRLVSRAQITGGGPGYELSVLVHETVKEA